MPVNVYAFKENFTKSLFFLLDRLGPLAEAVKSVKRKPKCSKGYHCSRNAYMLVYKVQEEEGSDTSRTNVEVPGEWENFH